MSSSPGQLAHHFENIEQQRETCTLGMWIFLVTEVMFFGGLFLAYTIYRYRDPLAFAEGSHHLDVILGTVNTGVLLVSSYTVAMAVYSAQRSRTKAIAVYLGITVALGTAFLGVKAYEYWHKYHEHHIPGQDFELGDPHFETVNENHVEMFYALYFAMTGLHAAHMVVGIGIFLVVFVLALRGRYGASHYTPVEIAGLYWHFVDIVWIFLFPLLYLVS